jgi:peroxiredoxin
MFMAVPLMAQNVGDPAPNFSYNALGGGQITLSDHQGKVVYIFFFGFN